jgi:hypothetical protein
LSAVETLVDIWHLFRHVLSPGFYSTVKVANHALGIDICFGAGDLVVRSRIPT